MVTDYCGSSGKNVVIRIIAHSKKDYITSCVTPQFGSILPSVPTQNRPGQTETGQERTGSKSEASSALETAVFPQWNSAVQCDVRSVRPQQHLAAVQCSVEQRWMVTVTMTVHLQL